MKIQDNRIEEILKEFERLFIHKGEDGDDPEPEWGWTIQGSYPVEVYYFLRQKLTHLLAQQEPLYEIPCSDGSHNSFWKTVVESPEWKTWEKEVSRRLHDHNEKKSKVYTGVWDTDECRECGWISPKHFKDFLSFILAQRDEELEKQINHIKGYHQVAKTAYSSDSWDAGFHDALFRVENYLVSLLTPPKEK